MKASGLFYIRDAFRVRKGTVCPKGDFLMRKINLLLFVSFLILLFSGTSFAATEYISEMSGVDNYYPDDSEWYSVAEDIPVMYYAFNEISDREGMVFIRLPSVHSKVYLNFYGSIGDCGLPTCNGNIKVYNTGIFDENTLTWNNKPSVGSLLATSEISGEAALSQWFNVTLDNPSEYIVLVALHTEDNDLVIHTDDSYEVPYISYSDVLPFPELITKLNSKTNNNETNISVYSTDEVNFNASFNQEIISWDWYLDGVFQEVNYNNISLNFSFGNHVLLLNVTNINGTSDDVIWNISSMVLTFDPSGYVKDQNGATVYNAKVQLSNATWTDPCTGTSDCFSGISGYWNTNIYADGVYHYNVSKSGYSVTSGNQAFTIGGVNNNFTLNSATGRIYGTIYEFSNVTGTKAVQGELQTLKTLSRPLTCSVGGTCLVGGGYVIRIHDMDTYAQIALIDILKDGTVLIGDELIHPNNKYKYKVGETANTYTYVVIDVGTMFDSGGEIQTVNLQAGFEDDKKVSFDVLDWVNWLGLGYGSPNLLATLTNILAWLYFSPSKTTDEAVTFDATNQNLISSTVFDFVSGDYTSFFVSLDAESTTGNAGQVGFAFTDDSVDTPPNFKNIYINQRLQPPYQSDTVDFNSIDTNGNKKVRAWIIFYQGYSSFKVYNIYATAYCAGCQVKPLEGASVYHSYSNNVLSSSTGAYSLNVPLSSNLIAFYKNGYESKNLTHEFNSSYPEFHYDIFLNKTGAIINNSFPYIMVVPDPVVSGSPPKALYKTLGSYWQHRIVICRFNQADNCIESFGVSSNTESSLDIPNYPIGTYSIYLSGSNLGIYWDVVASNNFTVIGTTPTVSWGASKYYLNNTMLLSIFNPTITSNVTVYYPNGTIMVINPYSPASTLYNYSFLAFGIPPGTYTAKIEGGNQVTTVLLNIDQDSYNLTVPDSLTWGSMLNIQFSSPGLSDMVIFDSENNVVKSIPSIIGQGTKQWNTSSLPNSAQTIKVGLIQNGKERVNVTVKIGEMVIVKCVGGSDSLACYSAGETGNDLAGWYKSWIYGMVGTSESTLFLVSILQALAFAAFAILLTKGTLPIFGVVGYVSGIGWSVSLHFIPLVWGVIILILSGLVLLKMMGKG